MPASAVLVAVLAAVYFASGVLASYAGIVQRFGADQWMSVGVFFLCVTGSIGCILSILGQRGVFRCLVGVILLLLTPAWNVEGIGVLEPSLLTCPLYTIVESAPIHLVLGLDLAPLLLAVLVYATSMRLLAPEEIGHAPF